MSFKQKVYQQYLILINEKILSLKKILDELSDSAKNETKSTAGDKHETSLAMLQIEQENTRKKYIDATEQKLQLEKIDIAQYTGKIIKGSLIKTNHGFLFLSIASGKIIIDNLEIIALSPQSPLGNKLLGLQKNDTVEMNRLQYIILNIE
jgi:hypothetical protein